MARQTVIVSFLFLIGVGIHGPERAMAQHSVGELTDNPAVEAAPPADSEDHQPYLFFPRAAAVDVTDESLSAIQQVSDEQQLSSEEMGPSAGLDDGAWSATQQFSREKFRNTIPIQYPLDNSAYEGEDPTGRGPKEQEGDWRRSSVHRPQEEATLDDQPWIGLYKTVLTTQTLPTGDKGFGITSFDFKSTFKFARWPFLFVTPRAGIHFLDGPTTADLPARLYDFSFDTTVYLPINDRWTVQATASPSLFSDLQASKNAFRMVGRGLVFYRWSPQVQLAGGFLYLGRKDYVALPAAGVIYTPNDDVKLDIMFPKPRAAYRYTHDENHERWVYGTAELGGGSWAVQRVSGAQDVATYRDLQLLLGIEHKEQGALNWQLEGGYVFSRQVQYLSKNGGTTLPSTAVLRVVLSY